MGRNVKTIERAISIRQPWVELIEREQSYAYVLSAPKRLSERLIPKSQPQPGFWRQQL